MPSNIIQINNAKDLQWQVGDSKMDDLIIYLNKIGFKYPEKDDNINSASDPE